MGIGAVARRWRGWGCALALSALCAAPAQSAPLGLNQGDTVTSISIDALKTGGGPGDGGFYDVNTSLYEADGRFTTVNTDVSGSIGQTDTDFSFSIEFISESLNILAFPIVESEAFLGSAASIIPDFIVTEGGLNVLFGNFVGNVRVSGEINVNAIPTSMSAIGRVQFTGGATNLLAALGGIGGQANVTFSVTVSDFDPSLLNLIGNVVTDGQIFNSNYSSSFVGSMTPLNAQPFVPEPSTALLLGGGLLGLLGLTRRTRGSGR